MGRKLSPEEIEQWKDLARKYHQAQTKLSGQRDRCRALLTQTEALLPAYPPRGVPGQYLRLQVRMLQLALANLDAYPLDSTVYQPPTAIHKPSYEANDLELKLLTAELDAIAHHALRRLAAACLAGQPGPTSAPAGWQAQELAIQQDPERRAAWERFVQDVEALAGALKEARQVLAELPADAPEPERLALLKALKVPAIAGLAYRVNTALKLIPEGEAVAAAVRAGLIPPARGRGPTGRPLTDRLKGLFNPAP